MAPEYQWIREVVVYSILIVPVLVFALDLWIGSEFGYAATITGIIEGWAQKSLWPEILYLLGASALYLHLFRGWLNEK